MKTRTYARDENGRFASTAGRKSLTKALLTASAVGGAVAGGAVTGYVARAILERGGSAAIADTIKASGHKIGAAVAIAATAAALEKSPRKRKKALKQHKSRVLKAIASALDKTTSAVATAAGLQ